MALRKSGVLIIVLFFSFSLTQSFGAWKKKRDHYEFTFEWVKKDWFARVNFKIPRTEVERSYATIKTYTGSFSKAFPRLEDQYIASETQPFKNKRMVRLNYERFISQDAPHLGELVTALKQSSKDKSVRGLAEHTLAFVQSIPYSTDFDNKSGYITPIRVLVENKGDCDSKSALMAAIMSGMDIKWKLLDYPGHILIGVCVPRKPGDAVLVRDQEYVLAEPAGPALRRLGSWEEMEGLQGVIGEYVPPPDNSPPEPELSEKEKLTLAIEKAKLVISKRNGFLVGAKVTPSGLKGVLNPNDFRQLQESLQTGDLVDLGKYPHPTLGERGGVVWAP